MATLIDGYNLIHAAGILSRNIGPGTLERARNALIGFLVGSLSDTERAKTTVIFDAKAAPLDGPGEQRHEGLRVIYAFGYDSADSLLEELIRADSAPRQLVVVSSDQRIKTAAKRRRATAIDSEPWYEQLRHRRREALRNAPDRKEKPDAPQTEEEIDFWLRQFGEQ